MVSSQPGLKRTDLYIVLGLFVITGILYARTTQYPFLIYDDRDYVVNNVQVHYGLNLQSVRWAFTTFAVGNWHPVTWLSLQLDEEWNGVDPFYYHLTNVLLHAANSALLFLVLRGLTLQRWSSAFVAALFGWHPLHVESVAWVAERKDVLSTFFWILTMGAYLRYVQKPGLWRYLLVALLLSLGLMAKPMVVTLPFVLLLLDYWPLRRYLGQSSAPTTQHFAVTAVTQPQSPWYRLVLEKVPFLMLAAVSCYLTVIAQTRGGAVRSLDMVPLSERFANSALTYVGYLGQTFWPVQLAVFYPLTHPTWSDPRVLFAVGLLAAISLIVLLLRRRHSYLAVGWLWYLGTLVPVIGLVQVGLQSMANRYTYIPLIGIFIMIAGGMPYIAGRFHLSRTALVSGAAVVLLALLGLTWQQIGYWKDNVTLWEHTLEISGDSFDTYNNLALARLERNDLAGCLAGLDKALEIDPSHEPSLVNRGNVLLSLGAEEQAFRAFTAAVKAHPESHRAQFALALRYTSRNQPALSIPHYLKAIELYPSDLRSYAYVGSEYLKMSKFADAKPYFLKAMGSGKDAKIEYCLTLIALWQGEYVEAAQTAQEVVRKEPKNPLAFHYLSLAHYRLEQYREAVGPAVEAMKLSPKLPMYHSYLGLFLEEAGQKALAKEQYDIATGLDPNWAKVSIERARLLATDSDPDRRYGAQALELALQACHSSAQPNPEFLAVLAMAFAEVGKMEKASATAEEALKLANSLEQKNLATTLQEQLQSYRRNEPIRRPN